MTWQSPSDGSFQFQLLGPQGKVGAGQQWYLRSPGSINGQAGLLPSVQTITTNNPGAINGNPNTVGQWTGSVGGIGGPSPPGAGGNLGIPTQGGSSAPAWQKPVMYGGGILGILLVLALGTFLYSKRTRAVEAERERIDASNRVKPAPLSPSAEPLNEPVVDYKDIVGGKSTSATELKPVNPSIYSSSASSVAGSVQPSLYNVNNMYGPPAPYGPPQQVQQGYQYQPYQQGYATQQQGYASSQPVTYQSQQVYRPVGVQSPNSQQQAYAYPPPQQQQYGQQQQYYSQSVASQQLPRGPPSQFSGPPQRAAGSVGVPRVGGGSQYSGGGGQQRQY
ncbi:hypothetical protein HDU98_007782 [Podochytrium sp. JEL0797]|nr:hypothetical protein HDU98_007782 [Podochytrium sp. JEL0797]